MVYDPLKELTVYLVPSTLKVTNIIHCFLTTGDKFHPDNEMLKVLHLIVIRWFVHSMLSIKIPR